MNKADLEEEERLYLQGGLFRYGLKPVLGTAIDSLSQRHLRDYFGRVLGSSVPPANDVDQWQRLLQNLELATPAAGRMVATVDGMLLFGKNPKRFLPQSGIRAICYLEPIRKSCQSLDHLKNDQYRSQLNECLVMGSLFLPSAPQPSASMMPRMGSFDDPSPGRLLLWVRRESLSASPLAPWM